MERHRPHTIYHARTIARISGAILGFFGGIFYGLFIINHHGSLGSGVDVVITLGSATAGAAFSALLSPRVVVDSFLWLEQLVYDAPFTQLLGSIIGLAAALLISILVGTLLGGLPWGLGFFITVPVTCSLVYVGVRAGGQAHQEIAALLPNHVDLNREFDSKQVAVQDGTPIVVDTSVLIDGRIIDVVSTGFIQGRLVIPTFVLRELQQVADSADDNRRIRGRRGLEVVEKLKLGKHVVCEISEEDFSDITEVDSKLLRLAQVRKAALLTNDFNLNRLASIQGVKVLNLNDLANALKTIAITGDELKVKINKLGKESQQGVGYLDDGTMVVVEGGVTYLNQEITVTVATVLQTPAGRMVFARIDNQRATKS